MVNFTKKMVFDYINGDDIEKYDIDTLENDVAFMTSVIDISNDKECYELCGDDVKTDFNFVLFCIDRFKTDEDFIAKVADTYLEVCDDDTNRLELLIILNKLIKNRNSDAYMRYHLFLIVETTAEEVEIEKIKLTSEDEPRLLEEMGETGFLATFDKYNSSPVVINYFAKKIVERLICPDDATIEDFLHHHFKSKEELEKVSIVNYLINYLSCYDPMLASYISGHIEILGDTLKSAQVAKNRWDYYDNAGERRRMNLLFDYLQRYMESVGYNCSFNETTMLYLAARELGVAETILKYDGSISKNDSSYSELVERIEFIRTKEMSFQDLIHLNTIKKMIEKFLSTKKVEDLLDYDMEELDSQEPENHSNIIDISKKIKSK